MRRVTFLLVVVAIIASGSRAEDKKTLIVTAITHESSVNERTTYHTTPGQSTTDCSGTGTDSGAGTMRIRMDCDTTTTPAKTIPMTTRTTDVSEKVRDSENMVYTIACTDRPNILAAAIVGAAAGAGGGGGTLAGRGNCVPLTDGDRFEAEIKGRTMWVHALKGGHQGKAVKIKYKILDIRKQTPPPAASNDQCRGDERDTSEVWRLGRTLGEKDNEIAEAIQTHGVSGVLIYLHGEADGKIPLPKQPQAQAVGTAATALAATSLGQEASAQSSALTKSLALAKRFNQHERDFLDFAKLSRNNRDEREISDSLAAIAGRTAEFLVATNALLEVYENISNSADRTRIQPLIKSEALRYSQGIEADMPLVNANLADTKLPAVAISGDRMKQDMRDAKTFLDSLQTSLE
jgi:hypothetical protein